MLLLPARSASISKVNALILSLLQVPLWKRLRDRAFRLVRRIPFVQRKIEQEMDNVLNSLVKEFVEPASHLDDIVELPREGWTQDR